MYNNLVGLYHNNIGIAIICQNNNPEEIIIFIHNRYPIVIN